MIYNFYNFLNYYNNIRLSADIQEDNLWIISTAYLILFGLALGQALDSNNLFRFIIFLEVMLLATSTLYVLISKIILNFLGFFYLLVILIIAAAEAVIGLTLIIVAYRTKQEILLSSYNFLIN